MTRMAGHSGQKQGLSFFPIRSNDDDVTTSQMGWTLRFPGHTLGSILPVRLDTRDHGALDNTEHGSYSARPLRSNNDATTLSYCEALLSGATNVLPDTKPKILYLSSHSHTRLSPTPIALSVSIVTPGDTCWHRRFQEFLIDHAWCGRYRCCACRCVATYIGGCGWRFVGRHRSSFFYFLFIALHALRTQHHGRAITSPSLQQKLSTRSGPD